MFKGDTVLITHRSKQTVGIFVPGDCASDEVNLSHAMFVNLGVHIGDNVHVANINIKYGKRIHVLPFDDCMEGKKG